MKCKNKYGATCTLNLALDEIENNWGTYITDVLDNSNTELRRHGFVICAA